MALPKITSVTGTAVHVPGADIDTDRIIPARYLKCVTFDDLAGKHFYDVRFDTEGNPTGHPLDDPRFAGASILLSGPNFGCGSSREHAPRALLGCGVRAVVAASFARIFFRNAINVGLAVLECPEAVALGAGARVEIDVSAGTLTDRETGNVYHAAPLPPIAREIRAAGGLMPWAMAQEISTPGDAR